MTTNTGKKNVASSLIEQLMFFLKRYILIFIYMYLCVYVPYSKCPQRPEERVRFHGIGVAGGCERPNMDARTQTQVLFSTSEHS